MRALVMGLAAICCNAAVACGSLAAIDLPANVRALFAATDNEIAPETRCEVIDWAADPAHGWPPEAQDLAQRYADICVLPHDDVTVEAAAAKLGAGTLRVDVAGNIVTILAKSSAPEIFVCCAPQMDLTRLGGSDYWVARRRIADPDHAMLSLMIPPSDGTMPQWTTLRGPKAPPKPDEAEIGAWKGQVLKREIKSAAMGETRRVTFYLPPGHTKDRAWPALFMGDEGAVEFAGLVERMIEAGEIRPIVIVSAESGEEGVVGPPPTQYGDDLRSADYLRFWPQGGDRFDRHLEFFAKELADYAVSEFGISTDRADRAVAGKSNGGVLAMWAGVMRPEVFASAIPMSPGWLKLKPEHLSGGQHARFFISAGRYEPGFIAPAKSAEAMLREAGLDVTGRYYTAGHYHDQWAVALKEALKEIFPPR